MCLLGKVHQSSCKSFRKIVLMIVLLAYQLYINFIQLKMDNPEVSCSQISPREMFNYDNHKNIPWNVTQYHPPALHRDYMKAMREKLYASQKKGVKVNDFYVTKRGFYMDYDLKVAKGVPSACKYQIIKPIINSKNLGSTKNLSWKVISQHKLGHLANIPYMIEYK